MLNSGKYICFCAVETISSYPIFGINHSLIFSFKLTAVFDQGIDEANHVWNIFWVVNKSAETIEGSLQKAQILLVSKKYSRIFLSSGKGDEESYNKTTEEILSDAGGICQDRITCFWRFKRGLDLELRIIYGEKSKLVWEVWYADEAVAFLSRTQARVGSTCAKSCSRSGFENFGGCWRGLGFKMSLTTWPTLPWKKIINKEPWRRVYNTFSDCIDMTLWRD